MVGSCLRAAQRLEARGVELWESVFADTSPNRYLRRFCADSGAGVGSGYKR